MTLDEKQQTGLAEILTAIGHVQNGLNLPAMQAQLMQHVHQDFEGRVATDWLKRVRVKALAAVAEFEAMMPSEEALDPAP